MKVPETLLQTSLPGYAALRETSTQDALLFDESSYAIADSYDASNPPSQYLKNPAYDKYMRMHKVLVGEVGAKHLIELADELSGEELPAYLDAAGSAYMEAALAMKNESTVGRIELANAAEESWTRSLLASQQLVEDSRLEILYEDTDQFRTALNIAFSPLMKSLIVGDVRPSVRQRAFADTLSIAQASSVQLNLAQRQHDVDAIGDHVGFLHECNVLLGLLNFDDPRYIPSPSFNRSDSGVYHPNQSHDIVIFNQHWGKIKKVIPIEVKSKASKKDRDRYQALIVRGKMHTIVNHGRDPVDTLRAFTNLYEGSADAHDEDAVAYVSSNLRSLLALYQRSGRKNLVKTSSPTTFHNKRYVEHMYSGNG